MRDGWEEVRDGWEEVVGGWVEAEMVGRTPTRGGLHAQSMQSSRTGGRRSPLPRAAPPSRYRPAAAERATEPAVGRGPPPPHRCLSPRLPVGDGGDGAPSAAVAAVDGRAATRGVGGGTGVGGGRRWKHPPTVIPPPTAPTTRRSRRRWATLQATAVWGGGGKTPTPLLRRSTAGGGRSATYGERNQPDLHRPRGSP